MELLQGQFLSSERPGAAWGQNRLVKVAAPGEGLDWEATVGGGFCWIPVAVRFTLKAGAAAAARRPGLAIANGQDETLAELLATEPLEEGKEATYTFIRDWPSEVGVKNANSTFVLPRVSLEEGWRIESNTVLFNAKDTYTNITLWVEEFEIAFDHSVEKVREDIHKLHEVEEAFTHV